MCQAVSSCVSNLCQVCVKSVSSLCQACVKSVSSLCRVSESVPKAAAWISRLCNGSGSGNDKASNTQRTTKQFKAGAITGNGKASSTQNRTQNTHGKARQGQDTLRLNWGMLSDSCLDQNLVRPFDVFLFKELFQVIGIGCPELFDAQAGQQHRSGLLRCQAWQKKGD